MQSTKFFGSRGRGKFSNFFSSFINLCIILLMTEIDSRDPIRPENFNQISDKSLLTLIQRSQPDQVLNFNLPGSLLSRILIPRPVESGNLTLCRSIFMDHFRSLSKTLKLPQPRNQSPIETISTWQVQQHAFIDQTPYGQKSFNSLIFTHDPTAPQRVILAAHIDSKIVGNPAENSFVGATDSAAPVAIILSIAKSLSPLLDRQLLSDPKRPGRITLQVVLLDGEEAFGEWSSNDSIYGARALAKEWSKPIKTSDSRSIRSIDQIQSFILLDLLGSANPIVQNRFINTGFIFDSWQRADERVLKLGSSSNDLGGKVNFNRKPFFVKRVSNTDVSSKPIEDDHLPFLKEGVPILHVIPEDFPSVWHQSTDDSSALDLNVLKDWELIGQISLIEYLQLEKFL